ncbi:hypothetical protein RJ639_034828 [Escallonia herrerae]|uniref:Pentatricopeptide repeat-containing protein n=1 Tax=Escallonia herrerae TaxID=1293975 RepID=A0AA89BC36_9ASTE|nr:hypothetical protein RJ639_034828 [Escallonia herrerae]
MLLTTKTTILTNFWVHHSQRDVSVGRENGVLFFNPSSRICILSAGVNKSCTINCGSLSLKRTINHRILDRNVEICGFCEVGNLKNAMELLSLSENIDLDSRTYCTMLQLCAELKSLRDGQRVHSFVRSKGVEIDSILGVKLVFMYVSCGDLEAGRRVFDKVANEKVFLWNLMINEYAKICNFQESIFLFQKMQELGVEVNSHTFSCVLKCFGAVGRVVEGERAHGYLLKMGFGSYNTVVNSLISFYFKCGRIGSAGKLFDELTDRDVITWNSMISGYIANGFNEKGIEVFIEMLGFGIEVDLVTAVSVLAACANIGSLSLTKALHAYGTKARFDSKMKFTNTLLDVYSKCGDMDSAICVFENMGERSVVSWTSMIAGYAREGTSAEAICLFRDMKEEGARSCLDFVSISERHNWEGEDEKVPSTRHLRCCTTPKQY